MKFLRSAMFDVSMTDSNKLVNNIIQNMIIFIATITIKPSLNTLHYQNDVSNRKPTTTLKFRYKMINKMENFPFLIYF